MLTMPMLLRGALLLSLLLSLIGCAHQQSRAERSVTLTKAVKATALQFTPMPDEVTTDIAPPQYPAGPIVNGSLESRMADLETHAKFLRAKLAAARCLQGTIPDTPGAQTCVDALREVVGDSQ